MNKAIKAQNVPQAIGPYSHAVVTGNMIYTSGQLGVDQNGNFVGGIAEQTNQCLINVKAILESAGFTMKDVVKTLVFLSDMNNFAAMNEVYAKHFEGTYPARSCVEVARLPKDALVEIEVIAVK
jgi:2-iminobutanoate/2-iminopropanoate deaminase